MLLTIVLFVSALVVINLLLLKFSVNKTNKPSKVNKKPIVLNPDISVTTGSEEKLAPTGS
ncbi:hypothetical protein [Seonamhaeicola sp.]|uniref:hypothetical protein n=1 Tax=Seonamhaeicola sp. TaxID=1912245 RepID=UPI002628A5B0|nr:hypothetical protein [Seonamhaeicola sp.]